MVAAKTSFFPGSIPPIRLLNVYKGLPVAGAARVLGASGGSLDLQVGSYQVTCLALQGQTVMQIETLEGVVRARTAWVDLAGGRVRLSHLQQTGPGPGGRMRVRVQPPRLILVRLERGGHTLLGRLVDLSACGFNVEVDSPALAPEWVWGDRVTLLFKLPDPVQPARLLPVEWAGRIVNRRLHARRLQFGFLATPPQDGPPILQAYIAARQQELQRELHLLRQTLLSVAAQAG